MIHFNKGYKHGNPKSVKTIFGTGDPIKSRATDDSSGGDEYLEPLWDSFKTALFCPKMQTSSRPQRLREGTAGCFVDASGLS
jgi:hypothetical protein